MPLRVALNAHVVGLNIIEPRRIDDIFMRRFGDVGRSGAVALFASHIPFCNSSCLNVVVDRMATIAERAGGALHVVIGVESGPPVGTGRDVIRTPDLVVHIPLRPEREVIIAPFRKVPLITSRSGRSGM